MPQPTGWLMPQMPTPFEISQVIVTISSVTPPIEIRNPKSQPSGVFLRRTIVLM